MEIICFGVRFRYACASFGLLLTAIQMMTIVGCELVQDEEY